MNAQTQILTLKRFLNQKIRIPQRQKGTKLSSGAVVVVSVYKNKQVVQVFCDIESKFLNSI